ncbi:MAG: energy transducer TonB [Pseudomonadota bacterium]|nr:energy transducer TonB [Pseudomonadota bacterium]
MGDVAYPKDALRAGLERGEALIQFTVTASGEVKDVRAIRSSNQIFARAAIRVVADYKCQGQGHDVPVQVPFGFKVQ